MQKCTRNTLVATKKALEAKKGQLFANNRSKKNEKTKKTIKNQEILGCNRLGGRGTYKSIPPGAERLYPGGPWGAGAPLGLKTHPKIIKKIINRK